MSSELVVTKIKNGVAEVCLNRPEKHNSLTLEMFHAIADAGTKLREDGGVRVAILHGAGPSFCSGLDFTLMSKILEGGEDGAAVVKALISDTGQTENLVQRAAMIWQRADFPVIAAVNGTAFGGGFQIMMGCDFRIASPNAQFSIMETHYGLIPDMGVTQTLPGVLRKDEALELALTARQFDSTEAARLGVITRIEKNSLDSSRALANDIAGRSPDAIKGCKRLFNDSWRSPREEGLGLEATIQKMLLGSVNQREAVASAMEKRPAIFE
jgi:enoyl-CoA hydratase/carnithine racemase